MLPTENRPHDSAAMSTNQDGQLNSAQQPGKSQPSDKTMTMEPYGSSGMGLNLNGIENGMEFLSVAAGVTAKRLKDAKNHVTANKESSYPHFKSSTFCNN